MNEFDLLVYVALAMVVREWVGFMGNRWIQRRRAARKGAP